MSYLLAKTTKDELLLMIAAEDGETRPDPWPDEPDLRPETLHARTITPPIQARGFCWLNMTDNLYALRRGLYILESRHQGFVVHLTWKGWDRVDELLASGAKLPTEEQRREYVQRARLVVEGGDHGDLIPLDVPNPRGIEPEPEKPPRPRRSLLGRIFGWA